MKAVRKSHTFKLKPTAAQADLMWQMVGNRRFVYNALLDYAQSAYAATKSNVINCRDFGRQVTTLRGEHDFLRLSHVHTLQNAGDDLIQSYRMFFKKQGGYPRFQSRRKAVQSFRYKSGVRIDGKRLFLPKIGWTKFRRSREAIGEIKTATVKHTPFGWFVSVSVLEEVKELPPTDRIVGIDMGLNRFAVLSTGEKIDNPRHYRCAERKLARLQKSLSRKKKGSANYRKAKMRLARQHARVARLRSDFLHKLSTRLIGENQAIGAETLSIKGLARGRMAKSVLDAAWSEFFRQLQYKSDWYGRDFQQWDRFYPSTKTCHVCKFIVPVVPLKVRIFVCPNCGNVEDRDVNASLNLRPVAVGHTETGDPTGSYDSDESSTHLSCSNACGDSVRRNGHVRSAVVSEARIPRFQPWGVSIDDQSTGSV